MQTPANTAIRWLHWLFNAVFANFVVSSSIWLCLALWIQQPLPSLFNYLIMMAWVTLACVVLGIYFSRHFISRTVDTLIYIIAFCLALIWFFGLEAKQDREWDAEVAKLFSYEKQGDLVTLHNVRNFDWHQNGTYTARWETRKFDLNQIEGVNVITSYWMGPKIAHTLVSFDFRDQKPLTFSIEIRKEKNEEFSAIGGFFRKFELSLIASDEKDIIYTRSNIRGEQVYFFPVNMSKHDAKALFNEYLEKTDQLAKHPKWYNTLTSNCTTLVFDMVQAIAQKPLPFDYRLIASGYLPNYLYDLHALDHSWDIQTWYKHAHINPKVKNNAVITSEEYSKTLREGLPVTRR